VGSKYRVGCAYARRGQPHRYAGGPGVSLSGPSQAAFHSIAIILPLRGRGPPAAFQLHDGAPPPRHRACERAAGPLAHGAGPRSDSESESDALSRGPPASGPPPSRSTSESAPGVRAPSLPVRPQWRRRPHCGPPAEAGGLRQPGPGHPPGAIRVFVFGTHLFKKIRAHSA
jgi:hypothetical protein